MKITQMFVLVVIKYFLASENYITILYVLQNLATICEFGLKNTTNFWKQALWDRLKNVLLWFKVLT